MGQINLYKIDPEKNQTFLQEISQKMEIVRTLERECVIGEETLTYGLTLYKSKPQKEKDISWNWILTEFKEEHISTFPNPKAILLIEQDDNMNVVTFGSSYFLIDKFCDRDFGFCFARKLKYKEINTTTLTSPHSRRNKMINTYVNYNNLEFDSGESFAKLKAKVDLKDDFNLYKETIEIGVSIKFTVENESLITILELIKHVNHIIKTNDDQYKIPVFSVVKDKDLIKTLESELIDEVKENPMKIHVSEMDIIGATEIFNHNDAIFKAKYNHKNKIISELSNSEIEAFCNEYNFDFSNIVLDIKIESYKNETSVRTDSIHNLIDYTNDERKCLLSKGKWYYFNDDFIAYLNDSIKEIEVINNPNYDFSKKNHNRYIDEQYDLKKDEPEYKGQSSIEVKKMLKKKYYAEMYYNNNQQNVNGFENHDRKETRAGNMKIELMDLYKDKTMFAVKIGNSSAKLCYAIDQSLSSLRMYKHKTLENMPEVDNVAVWFILDRAPLPTIEGRPDINCLEMLMLKNRLDQWKKEVMLAGKRPVVYINYVVEGE